MWATGQGSAAPWGVGFLAEAVSRGHLALEIGGAALVFLWTELQFGQWQVAPF